MDKTNPIWCNRPQDGEEYCKDYDSLRELLVMANEAVRMGRQERRDLQKDIEAKDKEIAQLDQIITVRNKREKVYREKVRFIEGELETLRERYIHAIPDSR